MNIKNELNEAKNEINNLKGQSFAYEILQDYKKANKRLFIMWIITFIALIGVACYTVYLLNDVSTVETTEVSQTNDDGYNNYIGNDGDITNGKANN